MTAQPQPTPKRLMRCEAEIQTAIDDSVKCNAGAARFCMHCGIFLCSSCAGSLECAEAAGHEFSEAC